MYITILNIYTCDVLSSVSCTLCINACMHSPFKTQINLCASKRCTRLEYLNNPHLITFYIEQGR